MDDMFYQHFKIIEAVSMLPQNFSIDNQYIATSDKTQLLCVILDQNTFDNSLSILKVYATN